MHKDKLIILFADFSHENQPKVLKNVNFVGFFIKIILCVEFFCNFVVRICK